ncbi:ABC transporter permease protein [Arthrobacter globiformis NBRC 12137]|uniref:ABC transporter permease protein n=1 Tax=Arthrobacter globiformis (strain ATCC 8010 / DSM 20124 / JCM 1332 / NBRC 12137 / NCIMB 8907 / NRRL B-2979 / 168) TaxID=1077972 RepID=H0QGX5_ARTG1|nr:sugar ABC transporter permease [Arthrobacter globiformis]GAB12076.1 ABC transporter permease protein [Arthrobacter globiformis NBRC 12137]
MTQTLTRHRGTAAAPPARAPRRRGADTRAGYTFLLPWLLGFILLTVGPMLSSLYLSFTNYNLFEAPKWIGLDNYTSLFQDERFLQSVGVTLGYVVFGTPLKLAAALAVALLLNNATRGQGFYRSAFYAPSLIGASVSIAIVWKAMFGDQGPVDQGLSFFGINLGGWVGNPSMTMPMMILLTVWQFGAPMVIFLAGLKQIPQELYEAASVDGAGRFRKFVNITFPMLSPVVFFNLLLETIHAFQIFASAYIISNGEGGPAGSTLFYTLYLYLRGFSDFRMGYASAMAWLLVIVVGVITLIFFRTSKSWVHYSGDSK